MSNRTPRDMTRVHRMAELYKSGKTLREIGEEYGMTRERVRQLIAFIGMSAKSGGQSVKAKVRKTIVAASKDARYLKKYGCTLAQYRMLVLMGKKDSYYKSVRGAFICQRNNARHRGIEWKLKLWDWWCIWDSSGKWDQRGRGQGTYVMARKGDAGAYEVGNVFICISTENNSDRPQKKSGLPCGVSKKVVGNCVAFVATKMIGGRDNYIGSFKTPDAAHNAYLAFNG